MGKGRKAKYKETFRARQDLVKKIHARQVALKNRLFLNFLMVRPLKDNKATSSQAVKVQPIRKMQRHFWLLILFVFNCANGLNKREKCR